MKYRSNSSGASPRADEALRPLRDGFTQPRWEGKRLAGSTSNEVQMLVNGVCKNNDSDLRGHQIALAYYRLAESLGALVDIAPSPTSATPSNACWFNFATWATVTISRDIRNERPPARIDRLLAPGLRGSLTPYVMQVKTSRGEEVGRALAWGQLLVFVSTALTYAEMLTTVERGEDWNHAIVVERVEQAIGKLAPFCDIRPHAPFLSKARHLDVIANAFGHFCSLAEPPKQLDIEQRRAKAQLISLANIMITAVEQDVVNPAVALVLEHAPRTTLRRIDTTLARWGQRVFDIPRQLTELSLPAQYAGLRDTGIDLWAKFMTDQILVMSLPMETLRLGRDIPPLRNGGPYFPADLRAILDPQKHPQLADLATMIRAFDRSRYDGAGTAARDWRRYDERMNWAVNLLRSRQQDPTLYWCPYTLDDCRRLGNSRYPHHSGDPVDHQLVAPLGWPGADN